MTSVWWSGRAPVEGDPLHGDGHYDDLVVGAGLTGLTTAVLLARAGRRVAVVEARHAGAVTTGHSTAKVSLLQGTKYSTLLRHQRRPVAEAYLEANREGQAWLLRFCEDHDVPLQKRDAVTYAANAGQLKTVRNEHEAAASLGLHLTWRDRMDVPFPLVGATVLADQLQLDPVDVVEALVGELRRHGGVLHQGLRATHASRAQPVEVALSGGNTLTCENLVLATGIPVLDRGLFFAKVEPERSYGLAFAGATPPEAMFLSAGSSSRSVRDLPASEGAVLMVGGAGHVVGRTSSEAEHLDELRAWTDEHFPGAVETHAWSAQDYASYDSLPHVGRLPRGGGHIFSATGFGKWGMTNGVAAGLAVAGRILGSAPAWAKPMERSVAPPRGVAEIARINLGVGWAQTRALARAELHALPAAPPESGGAVGRRKGLPVGVSQVEGRPCRVLGVCTHLGGTLHWNDAERSWDCPLHGSRFAADGAVLEGPATRPLKQLD